MLLVPTFALDSGIIPDELMVKEQILTIWVEQKFVLELDEINAHKTCSSIGWATKYLSEIQVEDVSYEGV